MGSCVYEVYADETRSFVPSTIGGIMTEEAGVVTGDLEVATRPLARNYIEVTVQYIGAEAKNSKKGFAARSVPNQGTSNSCNTSASSTVSPATP